jgi:hypothetical protein
MIQTTSRQTAGERQEIEVQWPWRVKVTHKTGTEGRAAKSREVYNRKRRYLREEEIREASR